MAILGYNPEEEITTSESESIASAMDHPNSDMNTAQGTQPGTQPFQTEANPFPIITPRIEVFNGTRDPEIIDTWFARLTQTFRRYPPDVLDVYKIEFASDFMSGTAFSWYQNTYPRSVVDGSFGEFERLVRRTFYPVNYESNIVTRYLSLKQTKTATEYTSEFSRLARLVPPISEEVQLQQFIDGLKTHLRIEMIKNRPHSLDEAMTRAIQLDEVQDMIKQQRGPFRRNDGNQNRGWPRQEQRNYPERRVDADGDTEMTVASLTPGKRLNRKELNLLKKEGRCYRCHEKGHMRPNCPKASQY